MARPVRYLVALGATAGLLGACSTGGVDRAGAGDTRPAAGLAGAVASTVSPATVTTAAPPTTAAAATTTLAPTTTVAPTTTTIPPTTASTAPAVPRVLLVGDGILWDATPAVQAAFAPLGVEARVEATWGFGLTRPDFVAWPDLWPAYVAEQDPDVVVVVSGPNDALPRPGPTGAPLAPGDPGWDTWYGAILDRAAATLTAGGAHVLWLGMLWPGQAEATPSMLELNRAMQALATRNPAVTYVDAPAGVAGPDGRYAEFVDGRRLRKPDGEHLCAEGAARFAVVVATALAGALGRPLDPAFATAAWRGGDWRQDGRYEMDGGEACGG